VTRTSALSLLVLAALAAPALAQPTPTAEPPAPVARLKPPAGWISDDQRAGSIVRSLADEPHFGGVKVGLDGQYLVSPTPGAILIASQIVTEAMPADPGAAATAELHGLRDGADAVDGAKIIHWNVLIDPTGRVHEALLEWTDPSAGTTVLSRTLVFRTKTALARINAECILGPDALAQRPACEASMVSLAPNTTALEPMTVSATPLAPPVVEPAALGTGTTARPSGPPPATIGERDGAIPSTLLITSPKQKPDKRPYYVIGGLALLGLAYWWNRREKARREGELRPAPAARDVPVAAAEQPEAADQPDPDERDGDQPDEDQPDGEPDVDPERESDSDARPVKPAKSAKPSKRTKDRPS